jgi:hypothetical protein
MKKFSMVMWGLKTKEGIVLVGHDNKVQTWDSEKEAIQASKSPSNTVKYKVIKLIIKEV